VKKPGKDSFGFKNYRDGALERIGEAALLLRAEQFAGAIYLAGRGVEGMLRAMIWKGDPEVQKGRKALETGHDLRELLIVVRNLGLISGRAGDLDDAVQRIGRLWYNNMRFAPAKHVESRWVKLGEVDKRRSFKKAANQYFDECSAVVKRCQKLCEK
jgi:hypothetical protein